MGAAIGRVVALGDAARASEGRRDFGPVAEPFSVNGAILARVGVGEAHAVASDEHDVYAERAGRFLCYTAGLARLALPPGRDELGFALEPRGLAISCGASLTRIAREDHDGSESADDHESAGDEAGNPAHADNLALACRAGSTWVRRGAPAAVPMPCATGRPRECDIQSREPSR